MVITLFTGSFLDYECCMNVVYEFIEQPSYMYGLATQFCTKVASIKFEFNGVGDYGLVYGYFIFIYC